MSYTQTNHLTYIKIPIFDFILRTILIWQHRIFHECWHVGQFYDGRNVIKPQQIQRKKTKNWVENAKDIIYLPTGVICWIPSVILITMLAGCCKIGWSVCRMTGCCPCIICFMCCCFCFRLQFTTLFPFYRTSTCIWTKMAHFALFSRRLNTVYYICVPWY